MRGRKSFKEVMGSFPLPLYKRPNRHLEQFIVFEFLFKFAGVQQDIYFPFHLSDVCSVGVG